LKQNRTGFCSLFPPVFFNRTGFTSLETAFEDVIEPGEPRQASRRLSPALQAHQQFARLTRERAGSNARRPISKDARVGIVRNGTNADPANRLQRTSRRHRSENNMEVIFPAKESRPAIARCLKT
jgi:hypothetical protein